MEAIGGVVGELDELEAFVKRRQLAEFCTFLPFRVSVVFGEDGVLHLTCSQDAEAKFLESKISEICEAAALKLGCNYLGIYLAGETIWSGATVDLETDIIFTPEDTID